MIETREQRREYRVMLTTAVALLIAVLVLGYMFDDGDAKQSFVKQADDGWVRDIAVRYCEEAIQNQDPLFVSQIVPYTDDSTSPSDGPWMGRRNQDGELEEIQVQFTGTNGTRHQVDFQPDYETKSCRSISWAVVDRDFQTVVKINL